MSKVLLSLVNRLLLFIFACFDFQNNYVMVYIILFKLSTVGHMLQVDMNQDCHGLACRGLRC